ncbi:hypothetical protein G9P44_005127 [Scheffersomyces stipitis]|nr:hypothetical protein G9P44_005127 [Scheffersomyces stipitis]
MSDKEKNTVVTELHSLVELSHDEHDVKAATTHRSTIRHEITSEKELDDAYLYTTVHEHVELDEATDRKLLRKIDFFLMPVLCTLYCFQFMDKLTNSYASILGLRTDLHMVGDMYSWTGSAFYLGYLVFEFPAVALLQRFPVAKTVGIFIILWGVVLCLHSIANYAGFIVLRTILGMLESSVTPGLVIITSQYYRGASHRIRGQEDKKQFSDEVFLRTAWWFASNGIGAIIGSGAIAFNIFNNAGNYSLKAWKLIFIVTGVCTIFIGIIFFIHIPDNPTKAWFLSEREKILVVERIRVNQQGFGNKKFKLYQFKEALLDHRTWLFFFTALFSNIPNGGLTNFASILLSEDMGFSTGKALLMQMPGGAVEIAGCVLLAYCSNFLKSRMFWAVLGSGIATIAMFLLAFSNDDTTKYAGYTTTLIAPIGLISLLSNISSNVTGHTKKVTVNAILLIGYCVGNLIGPQTFLATEAPNFRTAKICIAVFAMLSFICFNLIWISYYLSNKKKDREYEEAGGEFDLGENYEFTDLTDKENPLFRYKL